MDQNIRRTVTSYATYGGGLGVAHMTSAETNEVVGVTDAMSNLDVIVPHVPSINDASTTWLMDMFPELVNAGHLTLVNGHIFFFEVSASQLLSMLVAFFSLIFIIARGIFDLSLFFLKWKLDNLEKKEREDNLKRSELS